MPERIQLSRKKGWRKPEGAVVVARPSKWGNPFHWSERDAIATDARRAVVAAFSRHLAIRREGPADWCDPIGYPTDEAIRLELRGKDLACWCPPGPCHADVLLEVANQ